MSNRPIVFDRGLLPNYQIESILQRQNAIQVASISELSFESLDALKEAKHISSSGSLRLDAIKPDQILTLDQKGGRECSLDDDVFDSTDEAEPEDELYSDSYSPMESASEDEANESRPSFPSDSRPNIVWSEDVQVYVPENISFEGSPSVTDRNTRLTPFTLVRKFLTREILQSIVQWTNSLACIGSRSWEELTIDEIWTYFGVELFMALKHKDCVHDCWNEDLWGEPEIKRHMARRRYYELERILKCWNQERSDCTLIKISDIFNLLKNQCISLYRPGQLLCLDECVFDKKCCSEKISNTHNVKARRTEAKIHTLYDLETGYYLNFTVHHSSANNLCTFGSPFAGASDSENIACKLISPFAGRGHVLYMDSSYCSPELALFIKKEYHFYSVGRVDPKRYEIPRTITEDETYTGVVTSLIGEAFGCKVLIQNYSYRNKETFIILSTKHSLDHSLTQLSMDSDDKTMTPSSYKDFCKYMKNAAKTTPKYLIFETMKDRSLTTNIIKRIFNLASHNAYVLHSTLMGDKALTHRSFRKRICEEIFGLLCYLKSMKQSVASPTLIACNQSPLLGRCPDEEEIKEQDRQNERRMEQEGQSERRKEPNERREQYKKLKLSRS